MTRYRTFVAALITMLLLVAAIVMMPRANATTNPTVEDWTPAMNQEVFWESRFGAECTKFENHNGFIPAQYEIAIIKAGQSVTIYNPAPDDDFATAHDGKRISWVMKCNLPQSTTTTSTPSSTTTVPEETTTTLPEETTTTVPETTTVPSTTPTTEAPTTTVPEETTTTPVDVTTSAPELPFTGDNTRLMVLLGLGLLALGGLVARMSSERSA